MYQVTEKVTYLDTDPPQPTGSGSCQVPVLGRCGSSSSCRWGVWRDASLGWNHTVVLGARLGDLGPMAVGDLGPMAVGDLGPIAVGDLDAYPLRRWPCCCSPWGGRRTCVRGRTPRRSGSVACSSCLIYHLSAPHGRSPIYHLPRAEYFWKSCTKKCCGSGVFKSCEVKTVSPPLRRSTLVWAT